MYNMMKVLLRKEHKVEISTKEVPKNIKPNNVLIKVTLAALCRTDVRVAKGQIGSVFPIVLGHEFTGIIIEQGCSVNKFKIGDRVAVMPIFPCCKCVACKNQKQTACEHPTMLGLDIDGAFAQYVEVPSSSVFKVNDTLSNQYAAYAEPVAASLAILKSGIKKVDKGMIFGTNRIAELTKRIMNACGYENVELVSRTGAKEIESSSFDYIIETLANTESMKEIVRCVKPQGRIVLKSRQFEPLEIIVSELVKKEITLSATNYGSFEQAIELLESGNLNLDDLIGDIHALDNYESVFKNALTVEDKKQFFDPWI